VTQRTLVQTLLVSGVAAIAVWLTIRWWRHTEVI
jgi:hypothetical protein